MKNIATVGVIFEKFERQAVDDLQRLTETISKRDSQQITRIAHALKGAAGVLSAEPLCELAGQLEGMGRADDLEHAETCLDQLRAEVERCLSYLPRARQALAIDRTASAGMKGDHAHSDS